MRGLAPVSPLVVWFTATLTSSLCHRHSASLRCRPHVFLICPPALSGPSRNTVESLGATFTSMQIVTSVQRSCGWAWNFSFSAQSWCAMHPWFPPLGRSCQRPGRGAATQGRSWCPSAERPGRGPVLGAPGLLTFSFSLSLYSQIPCDTVGCLPKRSVAGCDLRFGTAVVWRTKCISRTQRYLLVGAASWQNGFLRGFSFLSRQMFFMDFFGRAKHCKQ